MESSKISTRFIEFKLQRLNLLSAEVLSPLKFSAAFSIKPPGKAPFVECCAFTSFVKVSVPPEIVKQSLSVNPRYMFLPPMSFSSCWMLFAVPHKPLRGGLSED